MDWCEVILWVDKQYSMYEEQGLDVVSPIELMQKEFDCIIVTVKNREIVEEKKIYY